MLNTNYREMARTANVSGRLQESMSRAKLKADVQQARVNAQHAAPADQMHHAMQAERLSCRLAVRNRMKPLTLAFDGLLGTQRRVHDYVPEATTGQAAPTLGAGFKNTGKHIRDKFDDVGVVGTSVFALTVGAAWLGGLALRLAGPRAARVGARIGACSVGVPGFFVVQGASLVSAGIKGIGNAIGDLHANRVAKQRAASFVQSLREEQASVHTPPPAQQQTAAHNPPPPQQQAPAHNPPPAQQQAPVHNPPPAQQQAPMFAPPPAPQQTPVHTPPPPKRQPPERLNTLQKSQHPPPTSHVQTLRARFPGPHVDASLRQIHSLTDRENVAEYALEFFAPDGHPRVQNAIVHWLARHTPAQRETVAWCVDKLMLGRDNIPRAREVLALMVASTNPQDVESITQHTAHFMQAHPDASAVDVAACYETLMQLPPHVRACAPLFAHLPLEQMNVALSTLEDCHELDAPHIAQYAKDLITDETLPAAIGPIIEAVAATPRHQRADIARLAKPLMPAGFEALWLHPGVAFESLQALPPQLQQRFSAACQRAHEEGKLTNQVLVDWVGRLAQMYPTAAWPQ